MKIDKNYAGVDWLSDGWFAAYHAHQVTKEFADWWLLFYSRPELYAKRSDYWGWCSIALAGWIAGHNAAELEELKADSPTTAREVFQSSKCERAWAPEGELEDYMSSKGFEAKPMHRHNATDGEYHVMFFRKDCYVEVRANVWDRGSFEPFLEWCDSKGL